MNLIFVLPCVHAKSYSLQPVDYSPPGCSVHKILQTILDNTGVDCHALLQRIFTTQELNPCLMSPALESRFFTTSSTLEAPFVFLPPTLKIHILKANLQCDGILRWGLWKEVGS